MLLLRSSLYPRKYLYKCWKNTEKQKPLLCLLAILCKNPTDFIPFPSQLASRSYFGHFHISNLLFSLSSGACGNLRRTKSVMEKTHFISNRHETKTIHSNIKPVLHYSLTFSNFRVKRVTFELKLDFFSTFLTAYTTKTWTGLYFYFPAHLSRAFSQEK